MMIVLYKATNDIGFWLLEAICYRTLPSHLSFVYWLIVMVLLKKENN